MGVNFPAYLDLPAVTTLWAEPVPAGGTACDDLVCSQPVLGCIPVRRNSWGYSQERVVLAESVVGTKRALTVHAVPIIDGGCPLMRKPTGTLVTYPPHTQTTAGCDPLVSQVLVFDMVPLPLQLRPEQADIWIC